jgi:ribonuclease P protein component
VGARMTSPTPTLQHSDTTQPLPPVRRHTLPKKIQLRSKTDYDAVFDARTRDSRGPLTTYSRPNGLPHQRFGMSVGRKVGSAVRRNRIRRLLRESYRLLQYDLPAGYDWVVVVRPHAPLALAEYQRLLSGMFVKLHNGWRKRGEVKSVQQ